MSRAFGFTAGDLLFAVAAGTGGVLTGLEISSTPLGAGLGFIAAFAFLFLIARATAAIDRTPPCRCGSECYRPVAVPEWLVAAECRACGLRHVRRGSRWLEIMPDNHGQVVGRQDFWCRWRPAPASPPIRPPG